LCDSQSGGSSTDRYWYRGAIKFKDDYGEYVSYGRETAVRDYVWYADFGNDRYVPEAVDWWVERRPMDCWERVT
jgi:hypothetical protein